MSAEMDALQQEVTEMSGVVDSAVAFIQGLSAQITAAAGDRAKSLQLAQTLNTKADELAAAIAA